MEEENTQPLGNEGQGDDGQNNQSGNEEKTFTQAEVDAIIEKRLSRERKKSDDKKNTAENTNSEEKPADKKTDENSKKLSALELKVLCYDHDINKEFAKEAIALANAYVDDDTDMDAALDKVIKKFPQFAKQAKEQDEQPKGWGQHHTNNSGNVDAVEQAFLKRNPDIKLD